MSNPHILIVGNSEECHVGAHFETAAHSLGWNASFCDVRSAYRGPRYIRALLWLCGRRPLRLAGFSQAVMRACYDNKPTHLLATGLAPIRPQELAKIGAMGIVRMNFLTDDPWNPVHRASWFHKSLRHYDHVFSPRQRNLGDLVSHGCPQVHYLPFAYSPRAHFFSTDDSAGTNSPELMLAGGADADRLPYIRALARARLQVALYGGYWNRYRDLKPLWRGNVDLATLRRVTRTAKIVLCLVRRANRDGHSMRSFEVPAMGGCMLTEDTPEHRDMFGSDGNAVVYFRSISEMVERARWLLEHEVERKRLACAAHALITGGHNTYADRLRAIMSTI